MAVSLGANGFRSNLNDLKRMLSSKVNFFVKESKIGNSGLWKRIWILLLKPTKTFLWEFKSLIAFLLPLNAEKDS